MLFPLLRNYACCLCIVLLQVLHASVFGQTQRSTASPSVTVLSDSLFIHAGSRYVRLRIYRPLTSPQPLPVLYMLDGQNLFDDRTSYVGEWGVDEILDSMQAPLMVVGIDHAGSDRIREYGVKDTERFGVVYGPAFLQWCADTLKPFIDKKYSTLPDRQNTWIAGSSMGGMIATWAITAHAKHFGGGGLFSSSYELIGDPTSFYPMPEKELPFAVWLYAGGQESENMMPLTIKMAAHLALHTKSIEVHTDANARHNEAAWRKWFPSFVCFMLNALQSLDVKDK